MEESFVTRQIVILNIKIRLVSINPVANCNEHTGRFILIDDAMPIDCSACRMLMIELPAPKAYPINLPTDG